MCIKYFEKFKKNPLREKGDILLQYASSEISNYRTLLSFTLNFLLFDIKKTTETHCHIISG